MPLNRQRTCKHGYPTSSCASITPSERLLVDCSSPKLGRSLRIRPKFISRPVSQRASGLYGIPGWFTEEQRDAWARMAESVHAKEGVIFAQLWHQGRTTHSAVAGTTPESSSATKPDGQLAWSGFKPRPYETARAMTPQDIVATQDDFVRAAVMARDAGFDGIEIHAGNGYLFDQYHHSNRTFSRNAVRTTADVQ